MTFIPLSDLPHDIQHPEHTKPNHQDDCSPLERNILCMAISECFADDGSLQVLLEFALSLLIRLPVVRMEIAAYRCRDDDIHQSVIEPWDQLVLVIRAMD